MFTESVSKQGLMGLDFFLEDESFIRDLTEEDESLISGGLNSLSTNNTNTNETKRRRRRRRRGARSTNRS